MSWDAQVGTWKLRCTEPSTPLDFSVCCQHCHVVSVSPFMFYALLPLLHHCFCALGPLLGKIRVTWTLAYYTKPSDLIAKWLTGMRWGQLETPHKGMIQQDGMRFYHAPKCGVQFKICGWGPEWVLSMHSHLGPQYLNKLLLMNYLFLEFITHRSWLTTDIWNLG